MPILAYNFLRFDFSCVFVAGCYWSVGNFILVGHIATLRIYPHWAFKESGIQSVPVSFVKLPGKVPILIWNFLCWMLLGGSVGETLGWAVL